jgi:hypothetical protein
MGEEVAVVFGVLNVEVVLKRGGSQIPTINTLIHLTNSSGIPRYVLTGSLILCPT